MKPPHIGFYVHYHGLGHKRRTEAILQYLTIPASIVTSRLKEHDWNAPLLDEVVPLACDNDDVNQAGLKHAVDSSSLHFSPLWTDSITTRVRQYTGWIDRKKPDLMVVDVSVEISMLTRLCSIPQVIMRQHGDRRDSAHSAAYSAAHSLLAPFPESMEDEITPDWIRDKTVYLHGFCRQVDDRADVLKFDRPTIVVMFGKGGDHEVTEQLTEAAQAVPRFDWVVIGKSEPNDSDCPDNLKFAGWVDDPSPYLTAADVVVTAAGHNSVMEVGRLGRPMIAIAEQRPFDEQVRKVAVLEREGLGVGVNAWPHRDHWPELIQRSGQLDPDRWKCVYEQDGAIQAADHLADVALWSHENRHQSSTVTL